MKKKLLNLINFISIILLVLCLVNLFGEIFMPLNFATNVNYIIFAIIATIVICLKNKYTNKITILIIISSLILIIEAFFNLYSIINYVYLIIGITYLITSIILKYNLNQVEKIDKIDKNNKINDGKNLSIIGIVWLVIAFIISLFADELVLFVMFYSILGLGGTCLLFISIARFYEFKKSNSISANRKILNTISIIFTATSTLPFILIIIFAIFNLIVNFIYFLIQKIR